MITLVIGNGESRKSLDLNSLSQNIIIGCNALHRDIAVDHLVCCDRRMMDEATQSPNTLNTKIYARQDWFRYYRKIKKDKRINQVPELPYKERNTKADDPIHWGSGPYAVLLSAHQQPKEIKLLGFDLYPTNNKINNVYKNTPNYGKSDSRPVDYNFWEYQISKVFSSFPDKNFTIVNNKDWKMPKRWQLANVSFEILATKNLTFA